VHNKWLNNIKAIHTKINTMKYSNLGKPKQVRPTKDSEKALDILKGKGLNITNFMREAIEEKLYKDFRATVKQIKDKQTKGKCPF